MKRLCVLAGLLGMSAWGVTQTIQISKPIGGEVLKSGQTFIISWTSSALEGKVAVHVYSSSGALKGVLAENRNTNGALDWIVGQCPVSGEALAPGVYHVRVLSMQRPDVFSDSPDFSVVKAQQAMVFVDFPKVNEVWTMGSSKTIRWRSSGIDKPVMLTLCHGEIPLLIIGTDLAPTGQFEWIVGQGKPVGSAPFPPQTTPLVIVAKTQQGGLEVSGRSQAFRVVGLGQSNMGNEPKDHQGSKKVQKK